MITVIVVVIFNLCRYCSAQPDGGCTPPIPLSGGAGKLRKNNVPVPYIADQGSEYSKFYRSTYS